MSIAILFLRFCLSVLFIFAGIAKFLDLQSFQSSLSGIGLLSLRFVSLFSYALPLIEIIIGGFLLSGLYIRIASFAASGLLIVFTGVFLVSYLNATDTSCGCFGSILSSKVDLFFFIRNVLLCSIGVIIGVQDKHLFSLDAIFFHEDGSSTAMDAAVKK